MNLPPILGYLVVGLVGVHWGLTDLDETPMATCAPTDDVLQVAVGSKKNGAEAWIKPCGLPHPV